ncbi:type II toxin-antitoxin system RatA family toxin [Effusibacillus lacus]|uniref:Cyclase n=1 Tax=Effusibacillus lacus TaxID=1348429 RepID=A0A292YPI5_9BACL|nr:aromatase/cyclase [Effusibacillus lacus]TCS70076.1 ribosome-associated toxin RatA of RatAB toxin-antitoxin module [Effusibacillus lacus]GAX91086.1 cyclase [Effusibacillus lacus]
MPSVEIRETIRGRPEEVYELIRDMESYPRFMPSLNEVKVLERGDNWTITSWDTTLNGMSFKWRERDVFDHAGNRIRYEQVEGDLKKFEGEWIVEQEGEYTRVTLTVDFEFGVPMLSALLNPVAKVKLRQNGESMLKAIKHKFENGAV